MAGETPPGEGDSHGAAERAKVLHQERESGHGTRAAGKAGVLARRPLLWADGEERGRGRRRATADEERVDPLILHAVSLRRDFRGPRQPGGEGRAIYASMVARL